MRICVLGAGGLGSVFGGFLAREGADVTLVGRPAHVQAIRDNGLQLVGIRGEHTVRNITAVAHPDEAEGDFDYLILGVKGKDTQTALESANHLRDRVACAFSFQNNVVKEQVLADWLGDRSRVIGFSTIEAGLLEAPGRVNNNFTVDTTNYIGELDGNTSQRVQAMADMFNAIGMNTRVMQNIEQVIWEKLTQIANAAGASISLLIGNPTLHVADAMSPREGAEHYVSVARDLLSIYKGLGYTPQNFFAPVSRLKELDGATDFEDAVAMVMQIGETMQNNKYRGRTSMHEDILRGRKTEVEFILGPFMEQSQKLDIPIPTAAACYRIIKLLDRHLA